MSAKHHISRLEAINGSHRRPGLAVYIESLPIAPTTAAVLIFLAIQTSENGVCWYTLRRLCLVCKASEKAVRRAIVEASEYPNLLWFVAPEKREGPVPFGTKEQPPLDAWGFVVPMAATDKAECARFVANHIAHTRGAFQLRGTGVEAWLQRWMPAANERDDHEHEHTPLPAASGE